MKFKTLPFLVSILPPSVFLLYLYQRNAAYLSIWHILIAIAVFTLGAVILQLIVSRLVKSSEAAAVLCNVLWILFFMIKAPYQVFNLINRRNLAIYLSVMIVITVIIITLIVRYRNKLQKQEIIKILSVFWLVIFIFNAVPAYIYTIKSHSKFISNENNFKTEFNINADLPSPNIYWLLMDGMLGFKAMEHLFNEPQTIFTSQLTERGFIINRDAQFEAFHLTNFSIPALMCPLYYDTYFAPRLDNIYKNGKINELKKVSMLARANNEFIYAFKEKGYYTNVIVNTYPDLYYLIPDVLYLNNQKIIIKEKKIIIDPEKIQELYSIFSLLFINTPLGKLAFVFNKFINQYLKNYYLADIQEIPGQTVININLFFGEAYNGNDKWYLNALVNIMNYSGSKLVLIHDLKTHSPFIYDKHGKKININTNDPYYYPSQHYFASNIVISYIDFILNKDPDAVIVIQAAHGLHKEKTRQLLITKYGKTEEDVRLMQNQTMSAVRIPEKLGGLEQPVEPLNITRLLVNRFVGENYKMLASEDIIK